MSEKRKWSLQKNLLALVVCLSMMLCTNCRTTTVIEKTIYECPDIDWAEFPEVGEYEKINDGKIAVDEDYFRRLLIFRTFYLIERDEYEEKKRLIEGGN